MNTRILLGPLQQLNPHYLEDSAGGILLDRLPGQRHQLLDVGLVRAGSMEIGVTWGLCGSGQSRWCLKMSLVWHCVSSSDRENLDEDYW